MPNLSYEAAVRWLRSQPEYQTLVRDSYLDEDNFVAAKRFYYSEEWQSVANLLGLNRSHAQRLKVLDLGCGNGIAAYAFACLGHQVTAVDPDPSDDVGLDAARRLAEKTPAGEIIAVPAFAESLPFDDGSFDLIYTRQVWHHFKDLNAAGCECVRVLKPHGTLLATREHVVSDERELKIFLETHILNQHHGAEMAYTLSTYQRVYLEAGFKIVKCLGPYDMAINHFPESNAEIRAWVRDKLTKKAGRAVAALLGSMNIVERFYRKRLSDYCRTPGRLFSFICRKRG